MPLDPRIPLGVRGPDPELFVKIADRFRAQQQEDQANREHAEDRKYQLEQRGKAQRISEVFADPSLKRNDDGSPDLRDVASRVERIDGPTAAAWWDRASAQEKATFERSKELASHVSQQAGALLNLPDEQLQGAYGTFADDVENKKYVPRGSMRRDFTDPKSIRNYLTEKRDESLSVTEQINAIEKARDQEIAKQRIANPDKNYSRTQLVGADDKPFDAFFENNTAHYYTSGDKADEKIDVSADVGPGKKYRVYDKPAAATGNINVEHEDGSVTREPDRAGLPVVPAGGHPQRITAAQKQQAQRWKDNELAKLENLMRTEADSGAALSEQEIYNAKLTIQNGYLGQIGLPAETILGPEWNARPGKGGATPAPQESRGTGNKTVTSAEVAAIAKRRGTTLEQERKRAAAAGYIVR